MPATTERDTSMRRTSCWRWGLRTSIAATLLAGLVATAGPAWAGNSQSLAPSPPVMGHFCSYDNAPNWKVGYRFDGYSNNNNYGEWRINSVTRDTPEETFFSTTFEDFTIPGYSNVEITC
ncbi:hypothetical protein [Fodinicola feengrottensis]|uniref:hypothetical protein n=1 Tax=Fodinicola feengrottensis TaxID=435914 RepID=UPI0013D66C03|nr:hypothetical protein [Fodinicola feengrottensis]